MRVQVQIIVKDQIISDELIGNVPSVWRTWGGYPGYKAKDCIVDKEGFLCHTTNDETLIRVRKAPSDGLRR